MSDEPKPLRQLIDKVNSGDINWIWTEAAKDGKHVTVSMHIKGEMIGWINFDAASTDQLLAALHDARRRIT